MMIGESDSKQELKAQRKDRAWTIWIGRYKYMSPGQSPLF